MLPKGITFLLQFAPLFILFDKASQLSQDIFCFFLKANELLFSSIFIIIIFNVSMQNLEDSNTQGCKK